MLFSWHCCLSLFHVGMWTRHVSMICSMLYGEVRQCSHGLPIFSIVGASNLGMLILLLSFVKLILFFSIFWYYCVEISAFRAAVPFLLPLFYFVFFYYDIYFFSFPSPVFSFVLLSSPSLASWSAFSLPSIPQCAGIQQICVIISFWCLSRWVFFCYLFCEILSRLCFIVVFEGYWCC